MCTYYRVHVHDYIVCTGTVYYMYTYYTYKYKITKTTMIRTPRLVFCFFNLINIKNFSPIIILKVRFKIRRNASRRTSSWSKRVKKTGVIGDTVVL